MGHPVKVIPSPPANTLSHWAISPALLFIFINGKFPYLTSICLCMVCVCVFTEEGQMRMSDFLELELQVVDNTQVSHGAVNGDS